MKVILYSPPGKKLRFNDSTQTASGSRTTGNAATSNPPSGQAAAVPYPAIPANDGANSLPDSSDEPWYKQFFSGDGNVQNIALRIFAGLVGVGVLVFGGLKVFKNKPKNPVRGSSRSGEGNSNINKTDGIPDPLKLKWKYVDGNKSVSFSRDIHEKQIEMLLSPEQDFQLKEFASYLNYKEADFRELLTLDLNIGKELRNTFKRDIGIFNVIEGDLNEAAKDISNVDSFNGMTAQHLRNLNELYALKVERDLNPEENTWVELNQRLESALKQDTLYKDIYPAFLLSWSRDIYLEYTILQRHPLGSLDREVQSLLDSVKNEFSGDALWISPYDKPTVPAFLAWKKDRQELDTKAEGLKNNLQQVKSKQELYDSVLKRRDLKAAVKDLLNKISSIKGKEDLEIQISDEQRITFAQAKKLLELELNDESIYGEEVTKQRKELGFVQDNELFTPIDELLLPKIVESMRRQNSESLAAFRTKLDEAKNAQGGRGQRGIGNLIDDRLNIDLEGDFIDYFLGLTGDFSKYKSTFRAGYAVSNELITKFIPSPEEFLIKTFTKEGIEEISNIFDKFLEPILRYSREALNDDPKSQSFDRIVNFTNSSAFTMNSSEFEELSIDKKFEEIIKTAKSDSTRKAGIYKVFGENSITEKLGISIPDLNSNCEIAIIHDEESGKRYIAAPFLKSQLELGNFNELNLHEYTSLSLPVQEFLIKGCIEFGQDNENLLAVISLFSAKTKEGREEFINKNKDLITEKLFPLEEDSPLRPVLGSVCYKNENPLSGFVRSIRSTKTYKNSLTNCETECEVLIKELRKNGYEAAMYKVDARNSLTGLFGIGSEQAIANKASMIFPVILVKDSSNRWFIVSPNVSYLKDQHGSPSTARKGVMIENPLLKELNTKGYLEFGENNENFLRFVSLFTNQITSRKQEDAFVEKWKGFKPEELFNLSPVPTKYDKEGAFGSFAEPA